MGRELPTQIQYLKDTRQLTVPVMTLSRCCCVGITHRGLNGHDVTDVVSKVEYEDVVSQHIVELVS